MSSDRELLVAWQQGEVAAGETLFERHFDGVVRFFRNKVGDQPPEDLVQKTFLGCVESRDRFRGDSSFSARLACQRRGFLTEERIKQAAIAASPPPSPKPARPAEPEPENLGPSLFETTGAIQRMQAMMAESEAFA